MSGTVVYTTRGLGYAQPTISFLQTQFPQDISFDVRAGNDTYQLLNSVLSSFTGDWIWILDDEHLWPPDALQRLLEHNKDVVAPLSVIDQDPYIYNALNEAGNLNIVPPKDIKYGLMEVYALPLTGALIKREVIESIKSPWFSHSRNPLITNKELNLCQKIKHSGYSIYVDTTIALKKLSIYNKSIVYDGNQWGIQYEFDRTIFIPLKDSQDLE